MQTMQTGTGLSREKQANEKQLHLDTLFRAVDQVKSDLTLCGKGLPESKRPVFSCGSDFFSVKFKRKKVETVLYHFNPDERTLTRRVGLKRPELFLEGVTDFYITFFPESRSVLYRIELNNKKSIRGYIFLVNMVN
jgi:hypothetical protein